MFPNAILYEINKELDCFCSILKRGVIFDVSRCSLECAPSCVEHPSTVGCPTRCGACAGFRDGHGRCRHWRKCCRKCEAGVLRICDMANITWKKGMLVVLAFFIAGHW